MINSKSESNLNKRTYLDSNQQQIGKYNDQVKA